MRALGHRNSNGSGHSAFKPEVANGVPAAFVPKPGPLKNGLNFQSSDSHLNKRSHNYTCGIPVSSHNVITSSYSSTGGISQVHAPGGVEDVDSLYLLVDYAVFTSLLLSDAEITSKIEALEEKRSQFLTLLQPRLYPFTDSREASKENKRRFLIILALLLHWEQTRSPRENRSGLEDYMYIVPAIIFGQFLPSTIQTAAGSSITSFGGFSCTLTTSTPVAPSQPALTFSSTTTPAFNIPFGPGTRPLIPSFPRATPQPTFGATDRQQTGAAKPALAPSLGSSFPFGSSTAQAPPAAPAPIPPKPAFGNTVWSGFRGLKPTAFVFGTPASTQLAFGTTAVSSFVQPPPRALEL
ncbi:hypothetical protein MUG91_G83n85 [Manis pentadactyla]|nr:hypothetical protein MUG91_G83n85 [Manis pentadactyla]